MSLGKLGGLSLRLVRALAIQRRRVKSKMNKQETCIVAAAQVAPVFLDRKATLEKTCDIIAKFLDNDE